MPGGPSRPGLTFNAPGDEPTNIPPQPTRLPAGKTPKPGSGRAPGAPSKKGDTTYPTTLGQRQFSDMGLANYEIIDEISRGGMGVVYKARQKSLNRIVAIKLMLAGADASEMDIKRFIREAEACANLKHPNIIDIIDIGKHEGQFYFAMEFIEGVTFDTYMKRADIELKDKIEKFLIILDAIEYAHNHKIIHRDLKPVNIMITEAGIPKVMDFGLAKKLKEAEGEEALSLKTATGAVMGTPHYMSPEQANGDTALIDARTDIFALGVIMYEMLTGVRPFRGKNINEIMYSIFNTEPERPTVLDKTLDWELEAIVLKAIEKEVSLRYATVGAMRDDIQRFLRGETILARKISKLYLLRRKIRRNKVQFVFALAVVVLLVAGGWFFAHQYMVKQREAQARITQFAGNAEADMAGAERLFREAGLLVEYPDVQKCIDNVNSGLMNLEQLDQGNLKARALRLRMETFQDTLKDGMNTARAVEKCGKGDECLKLAEADLASAEKAVRIEGKKKLLDTLQHFNEAYLIKPDLKEAIEGRFNATMRLAAAAREDKGYDLAILMYHQALALRPDDANVKDLYRQTEEESGNLAYYQNQLLKGKEFLAERKWDEAASCFNLARERIKDDPEIDRQLGMASYGKQFDQALGLAGDGGYIESVAMFQALPAQAEEEQRAEITKAMAVLKRKGADHYLAKAEAAAGGKDWALAETMIANTLRMDPDNKPAQGLKTSIVELTGVPEGMVYVKGGEFRKGSTEAGANNPSLTAVLESFYIGIHEVTNSAYYEFVADGGYATGKYWPVEGWEKIGSYLSADGKTRGPRTWVEGKYPPGEDDFPVTGISLNEARAYARWKAEKTGRDFRVCGEMEWEKAASWNELTRAQQVYPWGGTWGLAQGNFTKNPTKVGSTKTDISPCGCFDMAGNVSEWTVATEAGLGILKGGAYGQPESICLSYARAFNRNMTENSHIRIEFVGFRLACSVGSTLSFR
ncbi:MAG: protein kinase [Planctomycetota bacterium]